MTVLDYRVVVHVIEVRDLLAGKTFNSLGDPVCEVSVMPEYDRVQTQRTSVAHKTASTWFDETFVYDFTVRPSQFENGRIVLSVFDRQVILPNKLIGQLELGMSYVNSQRGHEIFRQWVVLTDPGMPGIVKGYVKLTCQVTQPGQSCPVHEGEDDDDMEPGGEDIQVLAPRNVPITGYTLSVLIFQAENLPKMDTFGKCDPYVRISFNGNAAKTKTRNHTLNPSWNQELMFPIYKPSLSDNITLEVWDRDLANKDDLIATTYFSFERVRRSPFTPQWVPLYGPVDRTLADKILGNSKNEVQEEYKGSILVELKVRKDSAPKLGKGNARLSMQVPSSAYTIHFELFEASELNTSIVAGIFVEVQCGAVKVRSKTKMGIQGRASWYETFEQVDFSATSSHDFLPDTFVVIYVRDVKGTNRLGHVRINTKEQISQGFYCDPEWRMIEPNKTSSLYSANAPAGFIKFRLSIGPTKLAPEQRGDCEQEPENSYYLRAFIYQARNLPSGDKDGFADPYVIVRVNGNSGRSSVVKRTLNPSWNDVVGFWCSLPESLELGQQVHVLVYDKDWFGRDDLLGRMSISTNEISSHLNALPKWYTLIQDGKETDATILCTFQLLPKNIAEKVERSARSGDSKIPMEYKLYTMEVSVLGLRGLKTIDAIPYSALEVEFVHGKDKPVCTQESDQPSVVNPNFVKELKFNIDLPQSGDERFAPCVNVYVYDTKLGIRRLLGGGVIEVSELLRRNVLRNFGNMSKRSLGSNKGQNVIEDWERYRSPFEVEEEYDDLNVGESDRVEVAGKQPGGPSKVLFDTIETALEGDGSDNENERNDARPSVPAELEVSETLDFPFDELSIHHGKQTGLNIVEKALLKKKMTNTRREIGKLKLAMRLYPQHQSHKTDMYGEKVDLQSYGRPERYIVRAYILNGTNLAPRDRNGLSDPYLIVTTKEGDKLCTINDRETWYFDKNLNPDFNKCYELPCILPGQAELTIKVMDRDVLGGVFGDDLIGSTVVDLENRIFSPAWKHLDNVPKETRQLWHPRYTTPQGSLTMFIDIMKESVARERPQLSLAPSTPEEYELRLVIYDCLVQGKGQTLHLQVVGSIVDPSVTELGGDQVQETDVNWSSTNGKGIFNWRMIFPVHNPCKNPRLKLQVWHKSYVRPLVLYEANVSLAKIMEKARKNRKAHGVGKTTVKCRHPYKEEQGEIRMELKILPASEAGSQPVGRGRGEPNKDPYLPTPKRLPPPWRLDYYAGSTLKKYRCQIITALILVCIIIIIICLAYVGTQLSTVLQSLTTLQSSLPAWAQWSNWS